MSIVGSCASVLSQQHQYAGIADRIVAPACRFADPAASLRRLRALLMADLHSTEQLLGQSAFGAHDKPVHR